ncbi:MAG: transcription elongation factor Spt5 [Nanoarchaeota archaeon]|nr:transcription elongation factor Spt5 [Nanoarchaeota archaeon]
MIYILRTTSGRENAVIGALETRLSTGTSGIKALLHPGELKGYLFVEGELHDIEETLKNVPHIRGMIKKALPVSELQKFLETKKIEMEVSRGDIVEVVGGPFKNEKGKITRVDDSREEVTIELLEAAIPIPITVGMASIRVLEKADGEKSE